VGQLPLRFEQRFFGPLAGVDNTELGAQMGRYIADYVKDKMGGNAKIALITIPKYEAGRQRREGFVKVVTMVPGVSIVAEQEGEFPDPAATGY